MMADTFQRGGGARTGDWRLVYGGIAGAIIVTGLAVRHPGLGLPWPVAKYAGSGLWGTMLYFCIATIAPKRAPGRRAGLAAFVAVLVELFRLYHAPWLDEFRLTAAGALLLGRIFSGWNILAYGMGIGAGAAIDRSLRAGKGRAAFSRLRSGKRGNGTE